MICYNQGLRFMRIFFDKAKISVKLNDEEYFTGEPIKQAREYLQDKVAVSLIHNY